MSDEETVAAATAKEMIATLDERDDEIESLRRNLVFTLGVSVGLVIALHLLLRRET